MDNWSRLLVFLKAEEEFPLTPDIEGSASTYTRAPAPYDKHLSSNLTPLHTKILDTLADILVENAEAKIDHMRDAPKTHPPNRLVTAEPSRPTKVKAEFGIAQWYFMRARMWWCQIAAALGLHNGNWDWSMLTYTMDNGPHYALADGALVVDDDTLFDHMTGLFPHSIDDKQRAVWKMLRERTTRNTIISWEFKSLFAGSKEVMESIVRVIHIGSFQWTICNGEECEKHQQESPHLLPGCTREKAQNIIQQVWAQACIKDLTYFVIHSGNFELICIRHRGSRTLYCSELIERCKNKYPYGLLQVGLYLAAIDDAVTRCHKADTGGGGNGGGGGGGGGGDGDDGTGDNGSVSGDRHGGPWGGCAGSGVGEGAGSGPTVSASPGTQPPRQSARIRTRVMAPLGLEDEAICIDNAIKSGAKAFVHLKYGVYDSVCPWVFHRVDPLRPSGYPESCHAKNSFSVILTSEIPSDKGTVVHGGVISVSTKNGTVSLPIIMKVGFNKDKSLIEGEYNIYKHLQQNGVPIPKVHGLFQDRDRDGATAILMDHAGTRIDHVPGGLSETQRMSFCRLLQQIHDAGVLHTDIAPRNLLVSGAGGPVIVDFGNAIIVDTKKRKAFTGELEELHHILDQCASEKGSHS
ncbi:hypothetical protein M405DRAFT_933476 [Rhizopogon salebrosus TDB-379]|nr:hypothetical protein M405DRAFT_933476 [Rhizopogon salebrosus TDB-379]